MIKTGKPTEPIAQLRQFAEEAVEKRTGMSPDTLDAQTPEETRLIFHELSVHQIELEMQNEELRRLQSELDNERARYFDLYDFAPVGYCTLSDTGVILEANRTIAKMLGISQGDLINQPFFLFIDGKDQDVFCLHNTQNDVFDPQVCELRMVKQNGTKFWAHLATTAVRTTSGQLECRLVISDITDRKQAEEAVHASEAQYRRIVETAQEGIWAVDESGKTTYVNPQMAKLLGHDPQEMMGRPFADFISPEETGEYLQRMQSRKQGQSETCECRFRHKEGREVWVLVSATPQRDSHGRFLGSFAMLTDITKRKRAEEALQQSEQRANEAKNLLKLVLDTIPVRLFWKDLTSTFMGCNRLFAEDAGFQVPEEVIGLDDYSMGWKEQAERYRRDDLEVMTSGKPKLQYEEIQTTPDGKQIWLSTSKVPLRNTQGEIIGVLGSYEDITRRKWAEEELLKAQKIESLGLLASGIAHDFNNILMVIMGNISFAKTNISPTDNAYERLTTAETAALKAQKIALQFLTFAKGGAPVKHSVSVANLVKSYGRLTLSGTLSTCEYVIPDDLWRIDADEGQIGQVVTNILINADQAMQDGGVFKVNCENVMISGDDLPMKSGRYVKISITDPGKGIPEEYLSRVFDPYFTTKEKGNGLGLTSAYSIVKKHEGYLTVESTEGAGATFTFFLPASLSSATVPRLEEPQGEDERQKILVMDDDAMVRDILGAMLERLGHEAAFATDGAQAVEKFVQAQQSGAPFDVVIMDLIVPDGMGGREAMERLQSIDPHVKVIVSSGYSSNSVMADFESYGFRGVMAKPYRFSDLRKKLREVILNEQKVSPR
ncbi:PAS domain S-box protein [uncultured Desulfobulbus sp.]|uniref:PAS domain-containing hybrid sensor histidine kinase/response regulator n=1 Tax=uncultured Desulfobulbus sp. TaxID=239745 RepID=UPI0029C7FA26|nr:PAS domain S-box protein [uncultured Desulfobulbus sp.]